jgi:predicted house-cleaning noncanonical NTP pyrophosphatase (MazG superfamily)
MQDADRKFLPFVRMRVIMKEKRTEADMIYNKLVRDRIPEIIEQKGGTCKTRILSDEEYAQKLDQKLGEELAEYLESHSPEELADLLEVIYACAALQSLSPADLELIRADKADKRGGFGEKILLIES